MFNDRVYSIREIATPSELANMLTDGRTWCLCAGFSIAAHPDYLFLNVSRSPCPSLHQEYAVIKNERYQLDSLTVTRMRPERLRRLIRATLQGDYDRTDYTRLLLTPCIVEANSAHDPCHFCR